MSTDAEDAWVVQQYLSGRKQREIGDDLGTSSSAICVRVGRFCDKWSGTIVTNGYIYNAERKQYAVKALQSYLARGGRAATPRRVCPGQLDLWHDYADVRSGDHIGYSADDYDYDKYWKARAEHAWLLRAEGFTFRAIGRRLGVTGHRGRQLVDKYACRMRWAARRAHFHWETETPRT